MSRRSPRGWRPGATLVPGIVGCCWPLKSDFQTGAQFALRFAPKQYPAFECAGSQRDADRAAFMYTLIQTAKLNNVDPQAWLADALTRMLTSRKLRSANCSRDRDDKRGHRM